MNIDRLTLFSKNIPGQKDFYFNTLGIPPLTEEQDSFSLSIGKTILEFIEKASANPYHFAINIPGYSEQEALDWLKNRVPILTDHGREIQDFTAWNARSVYFYDADRNIVEFIARRNLKNSFSGDFGPAAFMQVSEIGLAVNDIAPNFKLLKERAGLLLFDGDLEHFSAIGDEHGLFICINLNRKSWYPTGDTAYPSEFELHMSANQKEYKISYYQMNLQVHARPL